VIFYIILCLEAGLVLTFLPWVHPFGLADWGDNFFLVYLAHKTGLPGLQHAIASGWVRGAVTGIGLLNFAMAFWEIAHFNQTARAAANTRGTTTRLLVNDRADIARAAGADGVQLTTRSLPAHIVRRAFGANFLIGVSTHTLAEARAARTDGADFAVFGPLFDT